jgi:hypothetical protein
MSDRLTPQREAETPAEIRLAEYGERTTSYGCGAEKALHQIANELLAELVAVRAERDEIQRYAARLEVEICTCQPLLESGDYLHESGCRIAEIQMLVGHEEASR